VNVCNPLTGHGPVNRFCNGRDLAKASEHTVNAPNNDTLYSLARLDLSKQPQVLHAPAIKHRFWEFELVDPWTGRLPRGVIRVNSPYNRVWVIGRTYISGASDLANVHRSQAKYAITPLSKFGTSYAPPRPAPRAPRPAPRAPRPAPRAPRPEHIVTSSTETAIPGTQPGENPLAFYAALGREMRTFPAPVATGRC
jgi:hypothetical protein